MKSVSDCLNIIDDAINENIGKKFGISGLGYIPKYLIENGQIDFIEYRVALSVVLSHKNSKLENYYKFVEEDKESEYVQLRKLILVWLIECSAGPEIDD